MRLRFNFCLLSIILFLLFVNMVLSGDTYADKHAFNSTLVYKLESKKDIPFDKIWFREV